MLCLLWIDVVHIFDLGHKSDFRAEDSLKLAETAWSKLEWNKACYVCNGFIFEFGHKSDHRAEDSLKLAEPFRSKLEWNQACYALCEFMLSTSFNWATKVTIVLKIVWTSLKHFHAWMEWDWLPMLPWIHVVHIDEFGHKSDHHAEDSLNLAEAFSCLNGMRLATINSCCPLLWIGTRKWSSCSPSTYSNILSSYDSFRAKQS